MKLICLILSLLAAAAAPAADSLPPLAPEGEPYDDIRPLLDSSGRGSPVNSVAFSPDGKTLATGAGDKTVRIWDLATGSVAARLVGHTASVHSVAFSPDGKTLATGAGDKTVRIWDMATGRETRSLTGHTFIVQAVAFSPDGKTLASGSDDKTVCIWDLATGRETARLTGHTKFVTSVAFSPDGRTLATGSGDKTVRLWDPATGRETRILKGHTDYVFSVAFSPDGRTLATGSSDKTVRIWDMANDDAKSYTGHTASVHSVAFSPDGRTLATGSADTTVRIWDLTTGEAKRLRGHSDSVYPVAFSPDGKTLATGSWDKTVRLWDPATGRETARLTGNFEDSVQPLAPEGEPYDAIRPLMFNISQGLPVYSVAFSPDGKSLATGSLGKTVIWDPATGRETARLTGNTGHVRSVAFSPDGKSLATGSAVKTVRILGANPSPDGQTHLATGPADTTVRIWDLDTGRETAHIDGHAASVNSIAFSPDGRTLATGSADKTVRLWDPATGRETAGLMGHAGSVYSVAFSPDGKTLASGSSDKTVHLWDLATGRETARLTGHTASVHSVAFSPDGKTLATGSADTTVRIWDPATGRETARLTGQGHTASVYSVAFSPDGRTLATGFDDKPARLWDLATGHEAARLEGYTTDPVFSVAFSLEGYTTDPVFSVAFSPDGRTLATGSRGTMIWDKAEILETFGGTEPVAILIGGQRGTWAGCFADKGRCWRGDDGTLVVAADPFNRISAHRPPGARQELEASLEGDPMREVTAGEVLEIAVRVRNKGSGRAFWLSLAPLDAGSDRTWVFEASTLPFIDPGKTETLFGWVHLHTVLVNPEPVTTQIRLAVNQAYEAYDDPTRAPELEATVKPPVLKVVEARLLQDKGKQVLALTLENKGTVLGRTAFRVKVPDVEQQAEVVWPWLDTDSKTTLSFGLPSTLKPSGDLKVDVSANKLTSPGEPGLPVYAWKFPPVPVTLPGLPWAIIAAVAAVLSIAIAVFVYYHRIYRHPLVVRLTGSPETIRDLDTSQVGNAREALKRAGRLEPVLEAARVDGGWLDQAAAFDSLHDPKERCRVLADRLGCHCEGPIDGDATQWKVDLGDNFPLNLHSLRLCLPDAGTPAQEVLNRMGSRGEVALILGDGREQRQELAGVAPRGGMLFAPQGTELTGLLLAANPVDELARLIARHVPVTQLSPYQTGAGIAKQSLFFGRSALIARVMERDPANYLLVGGRQVGKSSMLKELERRYRNDPGVVCRYLVLSDRMLMGRLAASLGLPPESRLKDVLEHLHNPQKKRWLLLIDEADAFVSQDREQGYETLQHLRAVSEEGHAHFILAGFWSLYEQAVLDYQSPILNFGSILTVGGLEPLACRALAVEPMEKLNISWESEELVQWLIAQTGRRANLIAVACDEVLFELQGEERRISAEHLAKVLNGRRFQDLLALADLSVDPDANRLDRILVYAAASGAPGERLTLTDFIIELERHAFTPSPEDLKRSLDRLVLAFVLGREGNDYFFRVPLQRDLVVAQNPALLLQSELRAGKDA